MARSVRATDAASPRVPSRALVLGSPSCPVQRHHHHHHHHQRHHHQRHHHHQHRRASVLVVRAAGSGSGSGPAGGWFDLAQFVASSSSNKTPFDELAASIGKDIYIDVQGWHLFLRDVKIAGGEQSVAQALAAKLGGDVMSSGGRCDVRDVEETLKRTPVSLGRGKVTLSLYDVVPNVLVDDLYELCESFARENA
jgi:hypothetical protein